METILVAFWLLPYWYLGALDAISKPDAFLFGFISWAGIIGLMFGLLWGIVNRHVALCWFVISPVLSSMMFGITGLFARQLDSLVTEWLFLGFLLVQLAILSFLVFRSRGMRIPAISLSVFGFCYALFAGFFGAMALTGAWL